MERVRYCCDSAVRGYHIYQDIWEAYYGELLSCSREIGNVYDPFAVCVQKDGDVVGHVPRKISAVCSLFLRRNGTIHCKVTGSRRYSRDIVQGGLEIPCQLIFEGDKKSVGKVETFMSSSNKAAKLLGSTQSTNDAIKDVTTEEVVKSAKRISKGITTVEVIECAEAACSELEEAENPQDKKRIKIASEIIMEADADTEWVRIFNMTLKVSDRDQLLMGEELTDIHVNVAQKLILHQFPSYQGLKNTLVSDYSLGFWTNNYIQIVHCRSCHWITVSSIGCQPGKVDIYDSLYQDIDNATRCKIEKVFGSSITFNLPDVQKQVGFTDCGLFAIAFATNLAFGKISKFEFKQGSLRPHLKACFEEKCIHAFP